MKMGKDGDFIPLMKPGNNFYETLKNVFVEFNDIRMVNIKKNIND